MWVVKLGGSLSRDPLLKSWLETLVELGSGRVVIVPGGGGFADEVREQQELWRFDDLAAHNMAVLAMAQMALMMKGICPALALATGDADLRRTVQQARVPVWLPFEVLREQRDPLTTWGVTSDSLAAWLANRLNAEELVLVKACAIEPSMDVVQFVAAGILDQEFPRFTSEAAYAVTLLNRVDLPRVRGLLLNGRAVP
ncbi:MAG TPA: aspartate kinase [Burkholderiaceae bacterium]|nr:aspartate kinase [Burkholderiaceae bacterium]